MYSSTMDMLIATYYWLAFIFIINFIKVLLALKFYGNFLLVLYELFFYLPFFFSLPSSFYEKVYVASLLFYELQAHRQYLLNNSIIILLIKRIPSFELHSLLLVMSSRKKTHYCDISKLFLNCSPSLLTLAPFFLSLWIFLF